MKKRGVVILPNFGSSKDRKRTEFRGPVSPTDLRHYLLYWDRIDWPRNNLFAIDPPSGETASETAVLESEGILSRTPIVLTQFTLAGPSADLLRALMQMNSFHVNNAKADELWTICQPSPILQLPDEKVVSAMVAEVELYHSLPVPSADVAIEDVMKFKETRQDELVAFRKAMDDLYLHITSSPDLERATERGAQRVEDSLIALNRVMAERKWNRFFPHIRINLDLKDLVIRTAIGGAAGANFGLPTLGAAIGLVDSAVSVKFDLSAKPDSIPDDLQPYAYLHWAERTLS